MLPVKATAPIFWLILTLDAPVVDQFKVVDWPAVIVVGLAVNELMTGAVDCAFGLKVTPPQRPQV